jgi:aspergillopepsin I
MWRLFLTHFSVVFSSQSNQTLLPTDIPIYKPERSKTARLLDGYTFKILYGSGNTEANGDVFLDVLTIGGITASSQAVESVVNFTSVFAEVGGTGIVGMALDKNNTVRPIKQKTFFDNIKDQLAMPVLTADLYLSAQGSFNFGFINESLIDGDITWADVDTSNTQQGWWSIPVEGFRVGSRPFVASPFPSIVDTGTTTVFFPPDAVKAYYAQVSGASNSSEFGGFVFPCNSSLPDFNVTISGVELTIPGDQLNLGIIQGNTCFGTMQTVPTPVVPDLPQPTAVLGATFMLRYVTAFDLGKLQVGFGQKRFIENVTLSSIP